jgi:hypothetical protein
MRPLARYEPLCVLAVWDSFLTDEMPYFVRACAPHFKGMADSQVTHKTDGAVGPIPSILAPPS